MFISKINFRNKISSKNFTIHQSHTLNTEFFNDFKKNASNSIHVFYQYTLTNLPTTISLKTFDLIKPLIIFDISWSAGMIAQLLFKTPNMYRKKTLNVKNSRRDWSLWKYILVLWFTKQTYSVIFLTPLSIRIRRTLKLINFRINYLLIQYHFEKYATQKRSIKRWLKKKYTAQSWR